MAMKTKNDIVLPISFPVDTSGYSSSLQTMESMNRAFMGSLKSNSSPLFPDQSAALNKVKAAMFTASSAFDRVAISMGNTNTRVSASGKTLNDSVIASLRAGRELANQSQGIYKALDASVMSSVQVQLKAQRDLARTQTGSTKQSSGKPDTTRAKVLRDQAAALSKLTDKQAAYYETIGRHNDIIMRKTRRLAAVRRGAANSGFSGHLKIVKGLQKVTRATNKTTTANKKLSASTSFLTTRLSKAAKFFAIIEGPLGPHAGRLTAMASAVRNMGVLALGAGLLVGGLGMAMRRAIPAAIDLQRTMSTLSAATGDAKKSFSFVLSESRRTGAELGGLAASYAQLSAAAKGTILQGDGINKVFHAINTASSALRLDINQTKGTIKAIEQMMSKGTVSSEEMRQQLGERLPGAFRLAADAMDMTTQQFSKNLALGKIMATDMLPKLAKAMERAYGSSALSAQKTLGVALQQLNVEVTNFYQHLVNPEALDSFSSSINSITSSVRSLSDWLTPIPGHINKTSFAIKAFVTLANAAFIGVLIKLSAKLLVVNTAANATAFSMGRMMLASSLLASSIAHPTTASRKLSIVLRRVLIPSIKTLGKTIKMAFVANPWVAALVAITTAYTAYSLWMDVEASKEEAKVKLRGDKTTAGIKTRLDQQLALVKSSKIALAKANATPIDTGFWADNIAKQQAHKRAAQITYDAAVAGVKHERALLDAAVRADEVTIQALASRSTATQKMMNQFQKIIDNKTTTPIERALGSAKAALAAEITARHAFNKKATNLKHDLTKAEIHEARLQRKTHEGSIAVFKKQILSLTALREKEITKISDKETKAATLAKAQAHATAQALIATAHAKAIIGMKEGSDKAIRAQQSLDIEVAFNAYILASATETSLAKRKLLKAEFDNTVLNIKKTSDAELKAKADAIAGAKLNSNVVSIRGSHKYTKTATAASDALSGIGDIGNQFAGANVASDGADKSAAIDKALSDKRAGIKAKLDMDRQGLIAAGAQKYELDALDQQHTIDIKQAEIEATLAHNENLLSIQKQHYDNIAGLRNSFSELASSDQQTNLGGLLSGMMSFNTEIGNIQQLGNDLEKAKKEGSTADITKLEKQKHDATMSLTKSALSAVSGLMSSHNRKAFEVGKAAAVANAIINTFQGASAALGMGPIGIPLAAIIVAAGFMNVKKIMATKMGGASTATSPAVALPPPGPIPVSPFNAGKPQRLTTPINPASTPAPKAVRVGVMPIAPVNNTRTLRGTTPSISIVQHISAPNATVGTVAAIQQAAQLGAQQAVNAVGVDFANNGPLRQTLAV